MQVDPSAEIIVGHYYGAVKQADVAGFIIKPAGQVLEQLK